VAASGQWDGRGRLLAWLLAIATNSRSTSSAAPDTVPLGTAPDDEIPDVATLGLEATVPGPEEQAIWRERLGRVWEAVSQLSADKQEALRLVRVQGYKLEEAAHLLQIPVAPSNPVSIMPIAC